ncbi:MAG: superoxide dismutase, Ni [Verrucomicrobiota bacterium]
MKNTILTLITISTLSLLTSVSQLQAHCQVPCGIYDDFARVQAMLEDADTVIKAAKLINELAGKTDAQSMNQINRWVMNKESHAQKIISTMGDYFLTQRVKPDAKDYQERLKNHHAVILAAMKAKQNADAKYGDELKNAIAVLEQYYPVKK